MNKDQLLDAIGMVDEQKIRDAAMVKRTKWMAGTIAVLVILLVLATPTIMLFLIGNMFHEDVRDYTPYEIAQDIDNANVVTVYPVSQNHYTIYVPDGTRKAMRFAKWTPAAEHDLYDREILLTLRFHDATLRFYDGGFVRAETYDMGDYIGIYAVPDDLWQELTVFLAK